MDVELLIGLINEVDIDSSRLSFERPSKSRTTRILDSLAQILVSKPSGEAVAVGAQVTQDNSRVILTIATNDGSVPAFMQIHFNRVWTSLKNIATCYQNHPHRKSWQDLPTNTRSRIDGFVQLVSEYSRERYKHQMNKTLSHNQQKTRFEEFSDIVQSLDSEHDVTKQLLKALPDMEAINKWLQSGTPETYTHLYECFYRLYKRARNVLRLQDLDPIKDRCMSFVVEYLKKVAFFPTSFRTLMQLASSRRLRSRFLLNKSLEVRYVSANTGGELITLPEQPVLQELALAALRSKCKGLPPNYPTPETSEHLKRPTITIRMPIHCEVAVALDFLLDKRLPALPYIGVSKLSCLACWKFLSCLRKRKPGFHTRGTSGKANFPWKYPGKQLSKSTIKDYANAIYEEFYSEMAGRYTDCILEHPWSGASMEGEDLQCVEDILFQGIEGMEID